MTTRDRHGFPGQDYDNWKTRTDHYDQPEIEPVYVVDAPNGLPQDDMPYESSADAVASARELCMDYCKESGYAFIETRNGAQAWAEITDADDEILEWIVCEDPII